MAEIIRMPRMSDTMEEGNIVEWLKEEGDEVEPGDILAEVETDKATMELESYHEGVLLHIGVKEGPVPVNAVIAVIGEEGEDYEEALKKAKEESEEESEEGSDKGTEEDEKKGKEDEDETGKDEEKKKGEDEKEEKDKPEESKEKEDKKEKKASADESSGDRIKASPLAKKMAKEADIDISKVEGSGDGGRIIKRDIEEFKEKAPATPAAMVESQKPEEMAVSQMRKTIAKRLSESKFTAPHFYLTREVNMDKAIEARKKINEMDEVKISFNDLIVKAAAVALSRHPLVNASWKGDKIIKHKGVNVGVAVAIEEGLLVPVIRNANLKSLSQINDEVKEKASRAKDKKLATEEMQGNTFTVSNLGMFNIEEFTAIINPPDSCILAVGSILQKAVVEDGEIKVGNRMKVTMSCDHRVVDGATGAQFLQTFTELLEEPLRLVV